MKRFFKTGLAAFVGGGMCMPTGAEAATLLLERVLTGAEGLRVMEVESAPGDTTHGYVVALDGGTVYRRASSTGALDATPFLDGVPAGAGAFGDGYTYDLAFDPDYASSGLAYVTYRVGAQTVLAEYQRDAANPDRLDPTSHREVLSVLHTDSGGAPVTSGGRHDGGAISFGPDGYLYMTTGDSDLDFNGLSVSQDLQDLRGKVLRIDPQGASDGDYSLPGDGGNMGGGALPEIWASGLRNPFKASWDSGTGQFFLTDVGEDNWEEVNIGAAGANYGWSAREGSESLPGTLTDPISALLTDPFHAYPHEIDDPLGGHSITGGEVYRGGLGALAALEGQYLFGDYGGFGVDGAGQPRSSTAGRIWSFAATSALSVGGPTDLVAWSLGYTNGGTLDRILGFGVDGAGQLFVSDSDGELFAVIGTVSTVPLGTAGAFGFTGMFVLCMARRRSRTARRVPGLGAVS